MFIIAYYSRKYGNFYKFQSKQANDTFVHLYNYFYTFTI